MNRTSIAIIAFILFITMAGCGGGSSGETSPSAKGDSTDDPTQPNSPSDTDKPNLSISPIDNRLTVSESCQLKAIVTHSNGSKDDVSESATWETSSRSVATVSIDSGSKGKVMAVSPGDAVITAKFNSMTCTAHITVNPISQGPLADNAKVIFLHHSTGACIWAGGVPEWISSYNDSHGKSYSIVDQEFPQSYPYGWNNYPYDYWNIWVNHAGTQPYMEEPTLEILTQNYNVIIYKHCFPVSEILPDTGSPSIQSSDKRIENYKLQYQALKTKLRSFPNTRFIIWTGAALVQGATTDSQAQLARNFFEWVKNEWDEAGDNIYVFDFFELETEGGNVLKAEYAASSTDSHPSAAFSQRVAPYFGKRIVDVIEGRGDSGSLTGQ